MIERHRSMVHTPEDDEYHLDTGAGTHRCRIAQNASSGHRRSAFGNARVYQPGRLSCRFGSLPAPSRRLRLTRPHSCFRERTVRDQKNIQGLRTGLPAYRYQILAGDAGRNIAALFVRRDRSRIRRVFMEIYSDQSESSSINFLIKVKKPAQSTLSSY
jgi:hypothetical protein